MQNIGILFHPDYTVGYGISPYQPFFNGSWTLERKDNFQNRMQFKSFRSTTGGESHPAPRTLLILL